MTGPSQSPVVATIEHDDGLSLAYQCALGDQYLSLYLDTLKTALPFVSQRSLTPNEFCTSLHPDTELRLLGQLYV